MNTKFDDVDLNLNLWGILNNAVQLTTVQQQIPSKCWYYTETIRYEVKLLQMIKQQLTRNFNNLPNLSFFGNSSV